MPRPRAGNTSILAIVSGSGGGFSDEEFISSEDELHALPASNSRSTTRSSQSASAIPTRTRGGPAARKTASAPVKTLDAPAPGTTSTPAQAPAPAGRALRTRSANASNVVKAPQAPGLRKPSRRGAAAPVEAPPGSAPPRRGGDVEQNGVVDLSLESLDDVELPTPAPAPAPTRAKRTRATRTPSVSLPAPVPAPAPTRDRPNKVAKHNPGATVVDGIVDREGELEKEPEAEVVPDAKRTVAKKGGTKTAPSLPAPAPAPVPPPSAQLRQRPQSPPAMVVLPPTGTGLSDPPSSVSRWRSFTSTNPIPDRVPAFPDRSLAIGPDRQLAEARRQLEQLEIRYQALADLATRSSRENFEALERATTQQAAIQDQLIASLREEVKMFRASTTESGEIENQVAELEETTEELSRDLAMAERARDAAIRERDEAVRERDQAAKAKDEASREKAGLIKERDRAVAEARTAKAECDRLGTEVNSLTTSFQMLEKDNKMLSVKLSTATAQARAGTGSGHVNSDVSGPPVPHRPIMAKGGPNGRAGPTAEESQAQKMEKLKMEMYCDMTNLLVHSIKSDVVDGESVHIYDCSQTGTSGTLRFHLKIPTASKAFDQTEVVYTPILDPKNDRRLLEVLPEYLQDGICFQRGSLFALHRRIVDSLEFREEKGEEEESEEESGDE